MKRDTRVNLLILLAVLLLAAAPLALGLGDHKEEPFAGADGEAEAAVTELDPGYEPWFGPLYEPPSGEVESGLFALQAALGAGVLAYCIGLRRGRRQGARAAAVQAAAARTETPAQSPAQSPVQVPTPAGKAGAGPERDSGQAPRQDPGQGSGQDPGQAPGSRRDGGAADGEG
ncbi:energy-coupling factor ABC transporter substrate-binding protein [Streptomyces sp. HB2AG]|uniref:energy-coupling factor ABC transporter substrate-binding protein n=1 Tax=Streptomyces sp. HB2AG TaxID=2983400 RepID=UPI0022AAD196|nr:energy-coupling factor ABC transporter substrate-binding protein [Streptomyces sp. HB2AG]MCZ2527142.1 energy-coupling factor ABC transporter substrate-binding protein [Streptomyces sp. HB2AG]